MMRILFYCCSFPEKTRTRYEIDMKYTFFHTFWGMGESQIFPYGSRGVDRRRRRRRTLRSQVGRLSFHRLGKTKMVQYTARDTPGPRGLPRSALDRPRNPKAPPQKIGTARSSKHGTEFSGKRLGLFQMGRGSIHFREWGTTLYIYCNMRRAAIHAEACYYSIATNEACHYSMPLFHYIKRTIDRIHLLTRRHATIQIHPMRHATI
jgi:hypothetical protein